jgi:AcrR family transcriptional regulator
MRLFLEQGYERVTVEAVADASDVSRRTVFRYFEAKDELPFPDHAERVAQLKRDLDEAEPGVDPVEVVITATVASLSDFLLRPDLVLRRYQLTRIVPELREREVIEHERYVAVTRAYLREHLPESPPFLSVALASIIDAVHRSALGNYARSGGSSDAMAELAEGMEWVRRLTSQDSSRPEMLLAVVPDTPRARRALDALRTTARQTL